MRILWAVDALGDIEITDQAAQLILALNGVLAAQVEPVYVLAPEQLSLSEDPLPDMAQYVPAAKRAIEALLVDVRKQHPEIKISEPKVLISYQASLRQTVARIIEHATKSSFDTILVSSHGRKGMERWTLGSFSEELLLTSTIPVLIAGYTTGHSLKKIPKKIQKILFPTGMEKNSEKIFEQILELAKSLSARVQVLHAAPQLTQPAINQGVYLLSGGWFPIADFVAARGSRFQEISKSWAELGQKKGVEVEFTLDTTATSATHAITRHAETWGAELICMAAQSGRLASAVLGSVARQVVRNGKVPVWILRSTS